MANLIELEEFTPGVFQIETDTIWKGGTEGAANSQGKALANRTKWLKAQLIAAQNALGTHEAAADPHPQYATEIWVAAQIAALINAAPGALDTLDELATALGDDADFAATMANALALKAPLNSPIFSGDPRAPTPAADDNDTSIATTAFVKTAMASGFVVRDNAAAKNYTISVVSGVLALVEQA
jgi:hypothetical protein